MWADALQHTALQSLAADVASERIPAQGYAGMGVQNLSPYVVQLVADTGRVLLRVPPWTQSTHTPDVPCSYVIAQTVLAASPAALATVLQQYQVRVLLTHAALPERMEPLASSAALLGSLPPSYSGPTTDASGTITTANTAQQVLAAVTARKYLLFYNVSTTDTLWINLGATATTGAGSIPVSPLGGIVWESEFIPSDSLSVIGPTAGDAFTCKWA